MKNLFLPTDLFYGGDEDSWKRVANTLKLKIYLNTRLVDDNAVTNFFSIVEDEEYIQTSDQDFEFRYSQSQNNPDTRHQFYIDHYTPSGVNVGYMSNWFMDFMMNN